MKLPSRPPCFPKNDCTSCRGLECLDARHFWFAAKFAAETAEQVRDDYLRIVGSTRGPIVAEQLRAAANDLLNEGEGA